MGRLLRLIMLPSGFRYCEVGYGGEPVASEKPRRSATKSARSTAGLSGRSAIAMHHEIS